MSKPEASQLIPVTTEGRPIENTIQRETDFDIRLELGHQFIMLLSQCLGYLMYEICCHCDNCINES